MIRSTKKKNIQPKHVAITVSGLSHIQKKLKKSRIYKKRDLVIRQIVAWQVKNKIPILSFFMLPANRKISDEMDSLAQFFKKIARSSLIHRHQIKISVLGKWYDLPGNVVLSLKSAIFESRNYDRFFLNFCVNYDGQEEIVDACRLITRKVLTDEMQFSEINKETLKEHLYSSYFLPVELLIVTGKKTIIPNFLIWDCPDAKIHFTRKSFNELKFMLN